jgi:hypothetical protein
MWCLITYMNHIIDPKNNKKKSIIGCHYWLHFSFLFSSKLVLVTIHSHICDVKSFLHGATKDNHINNCKNDWFGCKSQTHVSVWTWFLVLRIGSIPFTLHKTKVNNLHKYVSTFMRNEVLMQEKNGEVCNQD